MAYCEGMWWGGQALNTRAYVASWGEGMELGEGHGIMGEVTGRGGRACSKTKLIVSRYFAAQQW
jgi:hypothetical protein